MHVTQGAVSRQIQTLEDTIGFDLFYRMHKSISLTRNGARLLENIGPVLDRLEQCIDDARRQGIDQHVTIAATSAMSHRLISKLPELYSEFPNLNVQILASNLHLNQISDQFDIGIVFGAGRWPGFHATFLSRDEVFPVCNPDVLPKPNTFLTPEKLLKAPLLHCDDNQRFSMDWKFWFNSVGVKGAMAPPKLTVSNNGLLMKAAVEGQGIALCWGQLVDDYLASGRLVPASDSRVISKEAYYAITKSRPLADSETAHVIKWLLNLFENPISA